MDRGSSLATVQVTESDTTEQLTLSHLGQAICVHTKEGVEIYQICTVNQANKNDWPKETWKKCPIKVIQTAMRVKLRDFPSESACVSIPCTILFPLKYTLCSLIFIFLEMIFYKAEKPGPLSLTTSLEAMI